MTLRMTRRRFTVAQYNQLAEAGILTEDDRVELIDGEIIEMTPIGRTHASRVMRLNHFFNKAFADSALVNVQNPIYLGEFDEPQPDLALLEPRTDFYASGHPRPADVLLLVEVSDSSIRFDREIKIPLYARAGIREVWLVDLNEDAIVVYRDPSADAYQTVRVARRGEWLGPLAFPGREIAVADILG